MRKYATSILLALTFVVSEIHTCWDKDRTIQNWILQKYRPMYLHWNIKYVGDQAVWIIVAIALLLYRSNKHNRTTAKVFLIWTIFDTCVYFVNFKTDGYGGMYYWLAAIWVLMFYGKKIDKYLWNNTPKPE